MQSLNSWQRCYMRLLLLDTFCLLRLLLRLMMTGTYVRDLIQGARSEQDFLFRLGYRLLLLLLLLWLLARLMARGGFLLPWGLLLLLGVGVLVLVGVDGFVFVFLFLCLDHFCHYCMLWKGYVRCCFFIWTCRTLESTGCRGSIAGLY